MSAENWRTAWCGEKKKKKKQLSGVRSLVSTERVFLSGSSKKKTKKNPTYITTPIEVNCVIKEPKRGN